MRWLRAGGCTGRSTRVASFAGLACERQTESTTALLTLIGGDVTSIRFIHYCRPDERIIFWPMAVGTHVCYWELLIICNFLFPTVDGIRNTQKYEIYAKLWLLKRRASKLFGLKF
jgi:hypothetical protein